MIFEETTLAGAYLIRTDKHTDNRGSFSRLFCAQEFSEIGLPDNFVQTNLSENTKRFTLRGMHYQLPPLSEGKLISCISGHVFDVIVDIRADSPTRHQYFSCELRAHDNKLLYVPAGLAHGFQTLEDNSSLLYGMTDFYKPGQDAGLRWDDPTIGIDWPTKNNIIISDKDANLPTI